jgi:hypothetical protein
VVAVVATTALAAWGCRRRTVDTTISPERMQRYEANMLRHAERDTGCPAAQLSPQLIHSDPRVYAVYGCDQPIEYWLRCSRNNRRCSWRHVPRLHEQAAPMLGCQPESVQIQPTQAPNIRYASGCGASMAFAIQCNAAACGWTQTVAPQGGGGVIVVPQQQAQAQAQPAGPAQAPPAGAPANALQSQVQTQREAILSCVDDATLMLRLRWTADGQVIIQLPPELVGTAAEGCIQAAVGALQVQAQEPGEIAVPLQ